MTEKVRTGEIESVVTFLRAHEHDRDGGEAAVQLVYLAKIVEVARGLGWTPPEPTREALKDAYEALAHEASLGDIGCVDRPSHVLGAAETFRDVYHELRDAAADVLSYPVGHGAGTKLRAALKRLREAAQ